MFPQQIRKVDLGFALDFFQLQSYLHSYCSYNPQPTRNDHSIAGTTILQTTLEDADSTQFYWWLDKSVGKGSSLDFKTFRCSTPSSVGSHERKSRFKPTFPFMATDLTMVLNTKTSWSPNYYLYHRICLTINKIAGRSVAPRPPMTDVGTETAFRLDQRKHFRKSKHLLRSEVSWCDLHLRRSTWHCTSE